MGNCNNRSTESADEAVHSVQSNSNLHEQIVAQRVIYKADGAVEVYENSVRRSNGTVSDYHSVSIADTSIAVVVPADSGVVLMQYRHRPLNHEFGYEFLGGRIKAGEDAREAAAREAEEESGWRPEGPSVKLGNFSVDPGSIRSRVHVYMWCSAVEVLPSHKRSENSRLVWMPVERLSTLMRDDELLGGPTIAVAFMLTDHLHAKDAT